MLVPVFVLSCFSLFYMTVNSVTSGLELLFGQSEHFKEVIIGSSKDLFSDILYQISNRETICQTNLKWLQPYFTMMKKRDALTHNIFVIVSYSEYQCGLCLPSPVPLTWVNPRDWFNNMRAKSLWCRHLSDAKSRMRDKSTALPPDVVSQDCNFGR